MPVASSIMGRGTKVFGDSWMIDGATRAFVKKAALHFEKMLDAVADKKCSQKTQRRRKFKALTSFDAKLCSVILGWPSGKITSLGEIEAIANSINAWADCGEPVKVRTLEKPHGGYRQICIFGPKRRALQRLALEVLKASWGVNPFEFNLRGLGREKAMQAIIQAIEKKGGVRWFLRADVKNCFSSFKREGMIDLIPLPKAAIENCVLIPDEANIHYSNIDKFTSEFAAPTGLPQGSLASSYVASKLLEPALSGLKSPMVVQIADDIFAGVKTKAEIEVIQKTLEAGLLHHKAGPLLMKHNIISKIGTPTDFLGYRVRGRPIAYGGGARLTPSPEAFDKFEYKLFKKLLDTPAEFQEDVAFGYRDSWFNANPSWDRSEAGDSLVYVTLYDVMASAKHHKQKALKLGAYWKVFKPQAGIGAKIDDDLPPW